jgi:hypothetical protein
MAKQPRSESPDDFLKRSGLAGYDGEIAAKDSLPAIDKARIAALYQPKDTSTTEECKDCQ